MVKFCCAINCSNRDDGKLSNISFHKFPKDDVLVQKWIKAIRRMDPENPLQSTWKPSSQFTYVCSHHFLETDYASDTKIKRLKRTAVPSVFSFSKKKAVSEREKRYASNYLQLTAHVAPSTSKSADLLRRIEGYRSKLRNVTKREKRLRDTLASLTIKLRESNLLNSELEEKLRVFKDIPVDLFKKDHHAYSERMKKFALTLNMYGSKAYDFCRTILPLPHPRTLRRWLVGYDGRPGFSSESFEFLKAQRAGSEAWQFQHCAVVMDAMKIKKYVEYDQSSKCHVGFVNFGSALESSDETLATEALVLMGVGVHGHWKLPLGYFLTNGTSGSVQKELLCQVFALLHDADVTAVSLTLDGHQANMSTIRKLGCNTDPENISTCFPHPTTGLPIYVFIDACHALKLIRNQFCALGTIEIPGRGTARWSHLVKLNSLQKDEQLRAANRLTDRHIEFHQQKMKVALAAQLLSNSVAKSLSLVLDLDLPGFYDAAPTIEFIQMVDRAFDLLNSRTPFAKGFKAPANSSNIDELRLLSLELECFFLTLEDDARDQIVFTRKSTGFLGMIFCLRSFICLSSNLLQDPRIKYILAYKFSQDHLELFFNSVRRACGWNNNPTSTQFAHIYKRMLMRAGVDPSNSGNCVDFSELIDDSPFIDIPNRPLNSYVVSVLGYIAGYVIRKVLPRLKCVHCRLALVSASVEDLDPCDRHLIQLKNNSGLVVPSLDVIRLLKIAESLYRSSRKTPGGFQLCAQVMSQIVGLKFFDTPHFVETDHFPFLVRSLLLCFLDIRGFHVAHSRNLEIISNRYRLTKQILFDSM